ncbi:MAG: thiamine pyrophosphate-dependent enzyme [Candidatus Thorarchaeota archaeon]
MSTSAKAVQFMSGNEAIARGALEAGVRFYTSYPGTPATEIVATVMRESSPGRVYCEWSVNEKVALEAAAGASWLGVPALCSMKSLGLNVAADFLLNLNLSGSGSGGLLIVVCDDPRGHSSSNEQDSRFYARAACLPLLEPSSPQQAKDIIPYALELSKRHEVPVILRSTTRLSHSRSSVSLGDLPAGDVTVLNRLPKGLFNIPDPHLRHRDLIKKLERISVESDESGLNREEYYQDMDVLVVSTGVCQRYASEAISMLQAGQVGHLGLVTSYPIPRRTVAGAMRRTKRVLVVEETDSFVEEELRTVADLEGIDIQIHGKRTDEIPSWGELDPDTVASAIARLSGREWGGLPDPEARRQSESILVPRPLTFCAGCTHRNVFWVLNRMRKRRREGLIVLGDIGCYSLGAFYGGAMETMQAMGSGIGTANGVGQLWRFGLRSKVIALAGDSTFFHSCIPALVNLRHKDADVLFLILDNQTTAMTGFQGHPGVGSEVDGHRPVSIERVVDAVGADWLSLADAENITEIESALTGALELRGLRVIILESKCRLYEERIERNHGQAGAIVIDPDRCKGERCKICVSSYACVAISWDSGSRRPKVLQDICVRCGSCVGVCPNQAIGRR